MKDILGRSLLKTTYFFTKKIEIPQNHFLGVLSPAEHESALQKATACELEGPQVDFNEISKLALYLEIGCKGI